MISIHTSIRCIGRDAWDSLCPEPAFFKYDYMLALESSDMPCDYLYAVEHDGSELICAAVASLWSLQVTSRQSFRVCTLGTPLNTGLAVSTRERFRRPEITLKLMRALARHANKQGVRVFIGRDFIESDLPDEQLFKLYNCATLDIRWTSFSDFISSIRNPKSARRDIRSVTKSGYVLHVQVGQAISSSDAERLHQLWLQLYEKHRSADQIKITPQFFMGVSKLPHCVLFTLEKDDRVEAFDLCFALGDTLESTYCGVNLKDTGRLPIHRVMGYHIVRHALESGFRHVNFGISNEASKVAMGCRLEEKLAWLHVKPAWITSGVRWIIQKFIIDHE